MSARVAPERPTFWLGVRCLWGGVAYVVSTPSVWPLALAPLLAGVALSVGLGIWWVGWAIGAPESWFGHAESTLGAIGVTIAQVLAAVLAIIAALLAGFSLAQPISGPALEAIVRRREASLGLPPRAPTSLVSDILRSLQSLLVGWGFGLPALALLFVLSLVVPAAGVVLFPLKLLVASCTVAWDLCDYPLAVKGVPVSERLSILWRNGGAVLGYALGIALAGMVPGLAFLLLPAGVAGAAQLMAHVEMAESSHPDVPS